MGSGSERAAEFDQFYREHRGVIRAACARRLIDSAAADDATSEVFRIAWQNFARRTTPELAWLYAIVRNVVGNEYRRQARAHRLMQRLGSAISEGDRHDIGLLVRDAVCRLQQRDREILLMHYWLDLDGRVIAQALGISHPAVWVRLHRARSALRDRLLDRD